MKHNENAKVAELRNSVTGQLPKFTSYGGYPLFYVDSGDVALCADCANANDDYDNELVDYDANCEDTQLYCDHCGERIESAYAEVDS